MGMENLLGSAVVAAIISGVFVFTYQQWLQLRIRRLEETFERERSFRQHSNEMLVSAYRKIWAGLVDIEHWLKHSLWKEVQSREVVSPNEWTIFHETYKSFRAEMLFLPDPLYDRTLALMRQLEHNANVFIDALREVIVMKEKDPVGYATDPGLVKLVNDAMDQLCADYRRGLDDLRHDYQVISRDLLLGGRAADDSLLPRQDGDAPRR